ncbi:MAG: dihydrodipicolinate synthase family protein, partial [Chitinophagaceae bacterium]|nr:dihydrodipicolinate synthase family protein [Chitinophagaceae bacterium]
MSFEWKGVFPALVTPFTAADEIDLPMFEKNLQAQLDAGVHGVIVGGSLGEASTITTEEKEQLVKHAVQFLNGRIPVIMNIAESTTRVAMQQAANAKALGAAGLMLLPPMRYKSDDRETVEYFKTIAKSTDLPIMIYNNPVDYKIDVTLDMFEQLIECSNITAV